MNLGEDTDLGHDATKFEELEAGKMAWVFDNVVYLGHNAPFEESTHPGGLNALFPDGHVAWQQVELPFNLGREVAFPWLEDHVDGNY